MRRTAVFVACVLAALATVRADAAPTAEETADAVLAALAERDEAALRALGARGAPDPFQVVEVLDAGGAQEAAAAFAAVVVPRNPDLSAYVAARAGDTTTPVVRAALLRASEALARSDLEGVLREQGLLAEAPPSVPAYRLAAAAAQGLERAGRRGEAAEAWLEAGRRARALRWWNGARTAFYTGGTLAQESGDLARAVEAYEALREAGEALGDPRTLLVAVGNLGNVALHRADWAAARRSYEESLRLAREAGDARGIALGIYNLAVVHHKEGHAAEADAGYAEALPVAERSGDPYVLQLVLSSHGQLLATRKDARRAVPLLERALALLEAAGDRASETAGRCWNALADAYRFVGQPRRQLEVGQRAEAIFAARGMVLERVALLSNLALGHADLGELAEARALQEAALRVLGDRPDDYARAYVLTNHGHVLGLLGELAESRRAYLGALDAARRGGVPEAEVRALSQLSVIAGRAGQTAEAFGYLETLRALAARRGDEAYVLRADFQEANLEQALGRFDRAEVLFRRALAGAERLGAKDFEGLGWNGIAVVHAERGEGAKALEAYAKAATLAREAGAAELEAFVAHNVARLHERSGRFPDALLAYERAVAIHRTRGDRFSVAKSLVGVGSSHQGLGNLAAALATWKEALQVADEAGSVALRPAVDQQVAWVRFAQGDFPASLAAARSATQALGRQFTGLAEAESADAREQWLSLATVGAAAARRVGDAASVVWFLESARAGALLESLRARDALRAVLLPEELRREQDAARLAWHEAAAARRAAARAGTRAARREARTLEERADQAIEEVAARVQRRVKASAVDLLEPRPDGLEAVQGRLEDGEALVLLGMAAEPHLAVVVRRDGVTMVDLPSWSQVSAALEDFRPEDPLTEAEPSIVRLRTLLGEPLALGDGDTRVLVCATGPLAYVPFSVLWPGKDVVYVPSATVHGALLPLADQRGEGVLAVGDPAYPAGPLPPLPATAAEVRAVGTRVLLGGEATVAAVTQALGERARWRAVHFACHGLVDERHPLRSALALTPGEGDDGMLRCRDLFGMSIPADLAVLSACQTGRGKAYHAEGVVGLARAFMVAGAPRVICSLWKVDDEATGALMTKFYELWNPARAAGDLGKPGDPGGLPTATALRKAQEHVRGQERWRHPHYWAAWVLWGLPR